MGTYILFIEIIKQKSIYKIYILCWFVSILLEPAEAATAYDYFICGSRPELVALSQPLARPLSGPTGN